MFDSSCALHFQQSLSCPLVPEFVPSGSRQQADVENSVMLKGGFSSKCEKFGDRWNQCVGPRGGSTKWSRFGLVLTMFLL